jgi:hypothetical protein
MLTYGLERHEIKTHRSPKMCFLENCITAPSEVTFHKLYSFGTYSFLPRDLLSLRKAGYSIEENEEGKMTTDLLPAQFPMLDSFCCDFYAGRESEKFIELYQSAGLFERRKFAMTDKIQVGQEIVLDVLQSKSGVKRDLPPIQLRVVVKGLHVGMYFKGLQMEYKTQEKSGFVEFQVISSPLSYSPLVFKAPLRKRKHLVIEDKD